LIFSACGCKFLVNQEPRFLIPTLKYFAPRTVAGCKNAGTQRSIRLIALPVFALTLFWQPAEVIGQEVANDSPVTVLSFRWSRDRRAMELVDTSTSMTPAPAMIAANKNFEKQRRINDPAGVRDPNGDTLDGRSAELDRITAEARAAKPQIDGFTYQAKVQNGSEKLITAVFWEYQFKEKGTMLSRRQFVCFAKVKPQKARDLEIFTLNPPAAVVDVKALEKKTEKPFDESVVINRVEYEDGSTWQRKDWNYEDIKLTAKPVSDSKKVQACRGL
jgi:hypothetical protein